MNRTLPRLALAALPILALLLPCPRARGEDCGAIDPHDRSDSRLPYAFDNTSWGMSPGAVEAVRGQAMERQADLTHEQVHYRFERVVDEELAGTVTRVRYTFYRDRLLEVRIYLSEDKIDIAESILLAQFQDLYGPPDAQQTEELEQGTGPGEKRTYPDKTWTWCDRFTTQMLIRRPDRGEVLIRRYSRLLYAELVQEVYGLQNEEMWKKVQGLEQL